LVQHVERRLLFGSAAELYERARPTYPDVLIDDVLGIAELAGDEEALEVGAGTGKATVQFASRSVAVRAIEPSAEMAAIARTKCAPYPRVVVEQAEFESWRGRDSAFGLVYSAQAWHWIRRDLGYAKVRELLRPRGTFCAFWSRPDWARCELAEAIDEVYRRTAPELVSDSGPMRPSRRRPRELWGETAAEIDAAGGFGRPEQREYGWTRAYSTNDYIELLQTHSDHIALAHETRATLLAALAAAIDDAGGTLRLDYLTSLTLARTQA